MSLAALCDRGFNKIPQIAIQIFEDSYSSVRCIPGFPNEFNSSRAVRFVITPEAEFLLPAAWREFRGDLGSIEAETLVVRRTAENGESDLVWESNRGNNTSKGPVRYAYYPSSWFLAAFPGGWKTLAEREGFELPTKFKSAP